MWKRLGSVQPGRAEAVEDVVDRGAVVVQPTQVALYEGQIRVQQLQLFKRCLGLLYSAGQGQPGNGIAQAGRPITIEVLST